MAGTDATRPRRFRRGRYVVLVLVAIVALGAVLASRGTYARVAFPATGAPAWTGPCARAEPIYEHEPSCARVRGRVVWRELDDPDGDADRHLVLLSRFRLRIVKLMPGRDYDRTIPAIGDTVEAVGFTAIGASGHREIYTEQLRR